MFDSHKDSDSNHWVRMWGLRRHRIRNDIGYSGPSSYTQVLNANYHTPSTTVYKSDGTPFGDIQSTVDQNNSVFLKANNNLRAIGMTLKDIGGPFLSERISVTAPQHVKHEWSENSGSPYGSRASVDGYYYSDRSFNDLVGNLHRDVPPASPLNAMQDLVLRGHGATGISRTLPTKSEFSLGVAAAELHQGLPQMIGSQLRRGLTPQGVGGEYLNLQFGILPLISDIRNIIDVTKRYEEILKQFQRDNGRIVRRRTTLINDETKSITYPGASYAYSGGGKYARASGPYAAKIKRTETLSTKVWFSGAYKLAYPLDLDKRLTELIEFNRAYGVMNPLEITWNLLPWSWLADWFTNVGDVVTNASTLGEGLQLRYGYVMCHQSWDVTRSGDFGPSYFYTQQDPSRILISSSVKHERKRRLKASPFDFSTGFADLSDKQAAILTALGLSRMRF